MQKLTDSIIRTAKPSAEGFYDLSEYGTPLFLRVKKNGEKLFFARIRVEGKQTKVLIGEYPSMRLDDARFEAQRLKREARTSKAKPQRIHPHYQPEEKLTVNPLRLRSDRMGHGFGVDAFTVGCWEQPRVRLVAKLRPPLTEVHFQHCRSWCLQGKAEVLIVLNFLAVTLDDPAGILSFADLLDRLAEFETDKVCPADTADKKQLDGHGGTSERGAATRCLPFRGPLKQKERKQLHVIREPLVLQPVEQGTVLCRHSPLFLAVPLNAVHNQIEFGQIVI